MHRASAQAFFSLLLTGCLTHGLAAGPSIGIAMANGKFQVDHSEVQGNASLFDGSEVTTIDASSKLRIKNGARLELGTGSDARIFANHAVLERGAGQVEGAAYAIEALKMRISGEVPKAIARVRVEGTEAIVVSAVNGRVRVLNPAGVLVASIAPGKNLRFEPQAAASDNFEITGCLLKKTGKVIIVDQTTSQVFELRGVNANDQLGNRVQVKGIAAPNATPMEGARQVVVAQSVTLVAPGGCLATAASVGADPLPGSTAVPAATGPAPSRGPNKAVIAGVAIGGAAAIGLGVALSSSNKSK
jgi:hypothetical protein